MLCSGSGVVEHVLEATTSVASHSTVSWPDLVPGLEDAERFGLPRRGGSVVSPLCSVWLLI